MSDLVELCARAIAERELWKNETPVYADDVAGRYLQKQVSLLAERFTPHALAVIDALADGVSDEMVLTLGLSVEDDITEKMITDARQQLEANGPEIKIVRHALSAAIRAAKSRDDTPPPPKD